MRSLLSILTAAILLGGCRSSSDPVPLKPVPFQLRSSVPADSVTIDSGQVDLSVLFDQEVTASDVELRIVPQPISPGEASTHGRTYDQLGIQLSQWGMAHWVLLDGPRFLRPYRIRLFTGDASGDYDFPDPENAPCLVVGDLGQIGQIDGEISSPPGGPDPQNAVIFAYDAADLPAEPDPSEIYFIASPVALTLADIATTDPDDWSYRVNGLIIYEYYTVIAVLDTSGDGIYDPHDDWWGYPQDEETRRLTYGAAHIDTCTPKLGQISLRRPIGSDPAP